MWLLESDGAFEGRRLWLRPGKTYLFGRTAAEPGQLAISHNTISRKHLTITVDKVQHEHAHHLTSRSKITIEDLATKIGTSVNGQKIKGEKFVVTTEEVDLIMGKCPSKFRITWSPVALTFSFTNREMQTEPLAALRERFEQLDIKLLLDYNTTYTTHVVSKKRNTAKGLQALINGKYIVTETFLDDVARAAGISQDDAGMDSSLLEQDFDANWPDPMQHLPPPGGEPVQHPDADYAPDDGRRNIFEGYTFVFYEQTQYNNLLAPITSGGGKAFLEVVKPGQTEVDDFVLYVKGVAGEKGLGSFEDGSEGKGVVLVRYTPGKGEYLEWYANFFRDVSLRLDHRPIEQSEFLEAILIKNASILRRPLEVESSGQPAESQSQARREAPTASRAIANVEGDASVATSNTSNASNEAQPASRRPRTRAPVKRRFAGFDDDDDEDSDEAPPRKAPAPQPVLQDDEGGLFVSQEPDIVDSAENGGTSTASQRKRQASQFREDDLMDGIAPAVDRFKRQRIESGRAFASPSPDPQANAPANGSAAGKKKIKKEIDVLAEAAKHRQEQEARAQAEKDDLANLPDDIDLAEIRRLNIVEEIEVRQPDGTRTREQDIADGRWDPKWNGMKDFKKFRRRGEATGRQPARAIVPLTEVKNKEYGVGDDYWLEDDSSQRRKKTTTQSSIPETVEQSSTHDRSRNTRRVVGVVASDSSDEENVEDSAMPEVAELAQEARGSRGKAAQSSRGTEKTTQSSRQSTQSQGKRSAPAPVNEQPAKRQRPARKVVEVADSDDSDDELKFRFGKRR